MTIFRNRTDAGQRLAAELQKNRTITHASNPIILGLPRGGVVVAFEIAKTLHMPLDVFVVRKIGVPRYEELAMGAIASGDVVVRNTSVLRSMKITEDIFQASLDHQRTILAEREIAYRGSKEPLQLHDRSVILVDDGLATGASMKAAIAGVRAQIPRSLIVAVPVAANQTYDELCTKVDDLICLSMPEPFFGVGQWYRDFRQTSDEEVRHMLEEAETFLELSHPSN